MELAQDSGVKGVEFFSASCLERLLKDGTIIYCCTVIYKAVY